MDSQDKLHMALFNIARRWNKAPKDVWELYIHHDPFTCEMVQKMVIDMNNRKLK